MKLPYILGSLVLGTMLHSLAFGAATQWIQVPQCLAITVARDTEVLAENNQYKIIALDEQGLQQLALSADELRCGRFKNLSRRIHGANKAAQERSARALLDTKKIKLRESNEPYEIHHQADVHALLAQVMPENITQTLNHLTSYHNRYANKKTGVETANWLKTQFDTMASAYGRTDTSSFLMKTGHYKQPSVVTVIGNNLSTSGVVLGAHMDTLDGRMPGAGDDASGSSSVMEAARVLLSSKVELKHPVYIIWYAAEEEGLVGSQYVVEHFVNKAVPVKAAVQFDMTGYRGSQNDPTIWLYKDYTDKKLTSFMAKLIDTYVHVPVDYSWCGYGCSDHASWDEQGFPAAFPCESNFEDHNPNIHTSADTVDLLSLEHMTNFTKLALAYVVELAL